MTRSAQVTKKAQVTTLAELQRNFISDCLSGKLTKDNTLMASAIDSSVISAQGLMGIYQNSVIANITQALSLTYPVIEKLVGEDFFRATCRRFISNHWPKSANMDDYGAQFPEFLANFEHAKHLLYLNDVACLEWAFHQSSLADDAQITDWSTLVQVTEILQLQFVLAPSVKLIHSIFPIDKIWQLNQEQTSSDIELNLKSDDVQNSTDTRLVVFRKDLKTVILPITAGEFLLLDAFKGGQVFGQAIVLATEIQADISMDDSLKKFIELGILSGFIEGI